MDANSGQERHSEQARRLAQTMADLAHDLQAENSRGRTLTAMLKSAVETVPGAQVAGISLVQDSHIASEAHTSEVAKQLDELQTELGDGPCLTSLRDEHLVRVDDFKTDERWPQFGQRAVELGVRSALSFRLFVAGQSLGALNLYANEPEAFGSESYLVGHLFAQHASVAFAEAAEHHHQDRALVNRDVIGQAKGILMQRDRLTAQQAFQLLTEASQQTNMKLAEVANWLVDNTERANR